MITRVDVLGDVATRGFFDEISDGADSASTVDECWCPRIRISFVQREETRAAILFEICNRIATCREQGGVSIAAGIRSQPIDNLVEARLNLRSTSFAQRVD